MPLYRRRLNLRQESLFFFLISSVNASKFFLDFLAENLTPEILSINSTKKLEIFREYYYFSQCLEPKFLIQQTLASMFCIFLLGEEKHRYLVKNGQTMNGINCVSEYMENKSLETVNVRKTNGQKHTVCFEINPVLWYLLYGEMPHSEVLKKVLFQLP